MDAGVVIFDHVTTKLLQLIDLVNCSTKKKPNFFFRASTLEKIRAPGELNLRSNDL
jgi:hypothetical protein